MNKVTKHIRVLYRIYPGKKQGAKCRYAQRANVRISASTRILMKFWMYLRTRTIKDSLSQYTICKDGPKRMATTLKVHK